MQQVGGEVFIKWSRYMSDTVIATTLKSLLPFAWLSLGFLC